jgi:hypothetical protein
MFESRDTHHGIPMSQLLLEWVMLGVAAWLFIIAVGWACFEILRWLLM